MLQLAFWVAQQGVKEFFAWKAAEGCQPVSAKGKIVFVIQRQVGL